MARRGSKTTQGKGSSRPGSRAPARTDRSRAAAPRSTSRGDQGRPATRPTSRAASSARSSKADAGSAQGSGLWRWGVIALVTLVLVVLLAPTVRSYFAQRSEIAALERQVAQGEERVAALQAEEERWRDPAYVEQQARERLKFVRPGEVSYTVIGAEELEGQTIATGAVSESRPWYDRMLASISQADRTDVELTP